MSDDLTHVQLAEKRLYEATMKIGITPQSAGVSAFVNSILQSCRIDALIEYTKPFELDADGNPIFKATFEEILTRRLTVQAEAFEAAASKPRLVAANGNTLNS